MRAPFWRQAAVATPGHRLNAAPRVEPVKFQTANDVNGRGTTPELTELCGVGFIGLRPRQGSKIGGKAEEQPGMNVRTTLH
jgi:hypothetical protein